MYKRKEHTASSALRKAGNVLDTLSDVARPIGNVVDTGAGASRTAARAAEAAAKAKAAAAAAAETKRLSNAASAASKVASVGKAGAKLGVKGVEKLGTVVKGVARNCGPKCMLMVGAAGYAGWKVYDEKKKLDEKEKLCYQYCFPQDWDKYVTGEIENPTYRDETDMGKDFVAEGGDPKALCTRKNFTAAGLMNDGEQCDHYCNAVCDKDWLDAAEAAAGDLLNNALQTAKGLPGIGPVIEAFEEYAVYIFAVIGLIILFKVVSMLGLFNKKRRNNNN